MEPIIKCISPYFVTFIKEDMTFSELRRSRGATGDSCMSCEAELWQRHCQITVLPSLLVSPCSEYRSFSCDDRISLSVALTKSTYDKKL
jgi:hypothetical protein